MLHVLVLEPVYVLRQYQHVEGLVSALVEPVMKKALTNNIRVIAYHRLHHHDYSTPSRVWSNLRPLYTNTTVKIHVDTGDTPNWKGPKITWDAEFQLFGTE